MKNLKVVRMAMGLSQGAAAKKVGLSPGWYSLIESGKLQASDRAKEKLTMVFGMPAEELLSDVKIERLTAPSLMAR